MKNSILYSCQIWDSSISTTIPLTFHLESLLSLFCWLHFFWFCEYVLKIVLKCMESLISGEFEKEHNFSLTNTSHSSNFMKLPVLSWPVFYVIDFWGSIQSLRTYSYFFSIMLPWLHFFHIVYWNPMYCDTKTRRIINYA